MIRRKVLAMNSNPNDFLPGISLAGFAFVVLWLAFAVLMFLVMTSIGWYDLFRPVWYQNVILWCGPTILSYLSVRALRRRITSRRKRAGH